MADDDNFDIDIYGDDAGADLNATSAQPDAGQDDGNAMNTDTQVDGSGDASAEAAVEMVETADQAVKPEASSNGDAPVVDATQQISSTGGSTSDHLQTHKQAPQQQGTKRKQGDDDNRVTDAGATAALMINDLSWWISEEDIRGWANQSGCEDELVEITFNEHKVNGKSKGQVYVQLQSPQASTALKHQLDSLYENQTHTKKPSAVFNPPHINPFKTAPKDVPTREKNRGERASSSNYGGSPAGNGGNYNRFNNRGSFNNNRGSNMGYQNRNFSGPAAGNMAAGMGGYGGPAPMNNFGAGAMGGMNNFGGGFNRGGMMGGGMRGGMNHRGARGGNMAMNNMGGMNMPMGGTMMGMNPGMMGMGGNMAMMGGMGGPGGFASNQPQFNPGFFNNQAGNDGSWNPHGHKRPRPE
ncbi:hypothetical protein BDV95DRAFT_601318 [Massariosphaeria phaeospora]|uniref:RRM domain-containing protein n=1 Tax=Massariosphaeria phaeospora TaxID=100035 RepID=A0A7C8MWX0_9PLEO|nr:hypothetical protein BDV95DRAFT_601318 [Massariosphaeria phaeospora]